MARMHPSEKNQRYVPSWVHAGQWVMLQPKPRRPSIIVVQIHSFILTLSDLGEPHSAEERVTESGTCLLCKALFGSQFGFLQALKALLRPCRLTAGGTAAPGGYETQSFRTFNGTRKRVGRVQCCRVLQRQASGSCFSPKPGRPSVIVVYSVGPCPHFAIVNINVFFPTWECIAGRGSLGRPRIVSMALFHAVIARYIIN